MILLVCIKVLNLRIGISININQWFVLLEISKINVLYIIENMGNIDTIIGPISYICQNPIFFPADI